MQEGSHLAYGSFNSGMAYKQSGLGVAIRKALCRFLGWLKRTMPGFFARLFSCCTRESKEPDKSSSALTAPLQPSVFPPQARFDPPAGLRGADADHNPLADITSQSNRQPRAYSNGAVKALPDLEKGTVLLCHSAANGRANQSTELWKQP